MAASKNSPSFSFNRFLLVSKRFFFLNQKNWLVGLLAGAGLLLSFWLIPVLFAGSDALQLHFTILEGTAMFFYLVGGLALTSYLFQEIHSASQGYQFLTLPASAFEKFSAAWFVSSLAYTTVVMAVFFILSIIIELYSAIHFSNWGDIKLFNPFEPSHLNSIGNYLVYHSIFLLGAIYFRKNNFVKTFLVIITFFIGMFIMIAISGFFMAIFMAGDFEFALELTETAEILPDYIWHIIRIAFTFLILLFSYIQLKNKQIA